jgi:hypothetical protein
VTVLAEANSIGGPILEQLWRDDVRMTPFYTTNATKAKIIEALALSFEQGKIKIPNDPVLIGELQAFQATTLPTSGLTRYSAPDGGHDDMVMSLALAHSARGSRNSMYGPYGDPETSKALWMKILSGGC